MKASWLLAKRIGTYCLQRNILVEAVVMPWMVMRKVSATQVAMAVAVAAVMVIVIAIAAMLMLISMLMWKLRQSIPTLIQVTTTKTMRTTTRRTRRRTTWMLVAQTRIPLSSLWMVTGSSNYGKERPNCRSAVQTKKTMNEVAEKRVPAPG